jgi:hypothetical protein
MISKLSNDWAGINIIAILHKIADGRTGSTAYIAADLLEEQRLKLEYFNTLLECDTTTESLEKLEGVVSDMRKSQSINKV